MKSKNSKWITKISKIKNKMEVWIRMNNRIWIIQITLLNKQNQSHIVNWSPRTSVKDYKYTKKLNNKNNNKEKKKNN